MYLDNNVKGEIERKAGKGFKIWLTLGIIFGLATLGGISQYGTEEGDLVTTIIFGVITVASIVFIILNVLKKNKLTKAERISNIFENDQDGTMTIAEIANAIHMPKAELEKNMLWFMNKGVLKNCRFDDKDTNRIHLTDVTNAKTNEFVLIHCQACGATVQTRPGQAVKCPSCGTFITATMEELLNR